jgi:ABC-2 type transport system ATP-binding protein
MEPGVMTDAAIRTRALSKRYGSTTAVRDLDLSVPPGVVYGFLGPNGAGKTTTMRMLTGLIEPTDGRGTVADVSIENRRDLVDHVGLLPEEPPLYNELTGREQLQFAADLRGIPWSAVSDRAVGICEELDLAADLDRRIEGYSKGMRRKTAFAQAVMHDPAVAFLDEPTSGLDPRAARTLRELIVDLAREDTTVFLSTHILPVVEEIADQVGILYDGRLVAEGSPDGLIGQVGDGDEATDLEDAFLELTSDRATL